MVLDIFILSDNSIIEYTYNNNRVLFDYKEYLLNLDELKNNWVQIDEGKTIFYATIKVD